MPKARAFTSKFFTISHYNDKTGRYAIGEHDYYFIVFCMVLFTGLRAGVMEHVLAPLAKLWGISKKKEITRFSEQAWLLVYYFVFWPLGWVSPKSSFPASRMEALLIRQYSTSTLPRPTTSTCRSCSPTGPSVS